jgi:hypothetical protein
MSASDHNRHNAASANAIQFKIGNTEVSKISESMIWDEINTAELRMSPPLAKLWEAVRIIPQEWKHRKHNCVEDHFWIVAIWGNKVIWYNDIESGFDLSTYSDFGAIDERGGNQFELEMALQHVMNSIETGQRTFPKVSAPHSGEFKPH